MTTLALGPDWLEPVKLINQFGTYAVIGLVLVIFAECGLLLGFFLPGDSLLFTAGLLVATGALDFNIWLLCVALVAAAIAGNLVGYGIGRAVGPPLFERPDSRLFRKEHVRKTHEFFERYGGRAIILGRFVPIVRTFITAMAGVGKMDFRSYSFYSTVGALPWAAGVTLLGYFLGNFDFVSENLQVMILLIVALSVLPIVIELIRDRRARRMLGLEAQPEAGSHG